MDKNKSHKQILKSTAVVGGAQIFSIIIGIFKTKVIAVLLGPSGVGIIGILQSTTDLVRNATSFGINFSGVKDVAEATGTGDKNRIDRTITILRRWALGTGLLGMFITIGLSIPLSNFSFGDKSYAISIAIISITLLITSISAGQIAILQGLRQIGQMAKATLYGTLLGTIITLPLYWWLGVDGIVPGMILTALGGLLISWWFASKVKIQKPKLTFAETIKGGQKMAQLGFFIVIQGFVASATLYIVRAFVASKLNIDAVGYYQASWMIANLYMGIVLRSMLADFFPRLSAINTDNKASIKLVNEQLEMALVVGAPMIISLMAFAGLVINVLYSSSFSISIRLLQWLMSSSFITLIAWPLGTIFLAKNKGIFTVIADGIWSLIFLFLIYYGWPYVGFYLLGIATLLASAGRVLFIIVLTHYMGYFSFSKINVSYIILYGGATIIVLLNVLFIENYLQYFISGIILTLSLVFSYDRLKRIVDIKSIVMKYLKK